MSYTTSADSNFRLVNIKKLSEVLGLSPSSIRHHIRCGRITPIRSFGRRVLFDLEKVREEITRGQEPYSQNGTNPKSHSITRSGKSFFESGIVDEVGFSKRRRRNE